MRDATPPGMLQSDFDSIHAAVMETARGRWFLAEYARRNRMADTRMILDAMARLENAFGAGPVAAAGVSEPDALAATAAQIAERLADIGWDLRERGSPDDVCAAVDRQATAVQGLAQRLSDGAESAEQKRLPSPAHAPDLRASLNALARLDSLPLAAKLELFV